VPLIEERIERATGVPVQIGAIDGSIIGNLRLTVLTTALPGGDGPVRSLAIRELSLSYRLGEFLPFLPWASADQLEWLTRQPIAAGSVVQYASDSVPEHLEIELDGSFELVTVDGVIAADLRAHIYGAASASDTGGEIALTQIVAPWWPDDQKRIAVRFTAGPGEIQFKTIEDRTSEGFTFMARAESETTESGSAELRTATLRADAKPIEISALAEEERLTLSVEIAEPPPVNGTIRQFVTPEVLDIGTIDLSVAAVRTPGQSRPILSLLLSDPGALAHGTNLRANLEANEWSLLGFSIERLESEVTRENGGPAVVSLVAQAEGVEIEADGSLEIPLETPLLDELEGDLSATALVTEPDQLLGLLVERGFISGVPAEIDAGEQVEFSVALDGTAANAEVTARLSAVGPRISGYPFEQVETTVSLSLTEALESVVLNALTVVPDFGAYGTIRLARPVEIGWAGGRYSLGELELRSGVGAITATGWYDPGPVGDSVNDGARVSAEVAARKVPLSFLLDTANPDIAAGASGFVNLEATAEGALERPDLTVLVTGNDLAVGNEPVAIELFVEQSGSGIGLQTLAVDLAGLGNLTGSGVIPITVGSGGISPSGAVDSFRLDVSASLTGTLGVVAAPVIEQWPDATLGLEARFRGQDGLLRITSTGIEREEELTLVGVRPFTTFEFAAEFDRIAAGGVSVSAELTSDTARLAWVEGQLGSPGDGRTALPLQTDTSELSANGELSLPLPELSHLVPGIDLPGGRVTGTFDVERRAGSFSSSADIMLDNALIKIAPIVPALSRLSGAIRYDGARITIDTLEGEMGRAPITVSGSVALSEEEESPIAVSITGRNALLARSPDLRLRSDVDLQISGGFDESRVTGRLAVTDFLFTRPIELFNLGSSAASPGEDLELFRISAPWARSVLLDIRATADRTLRIENNLLDAMLSTDLRLGGSAALPRPSGRVFASDGVVSLPTAALIIDNLELRFPAADAFSPQIFLESSTQVEGYEMAVNVDGQIPNMEVNVVSSPPLPTDEAILLLTTGQTTSDLAFTSDATGTLTAVGTIVGRTFLNRVSGELAEEGQQFLDRLDFEIGRQTEGGGIGTIDIEYQLAEGSPWRLLIDRGTDESYSLQLGWRLWVE
jgi:hypothetical protein